MTEAVIFIPHTPGSILKKDLNDEERSRGGKTKVKGWKNKGQVCGVFRDKCTKLCRQKGPLGGSLWTK